MLRKKVALYTRVSTVEQAEEGYSIDEQERLLREFCGKEDYEVYKCYSDRGISGKNITARPSLQEMLRDAQEKKFQLVLVWKINRLSRNLLDLLKMVDLLDKVGIAFRSLSEHFETETTTGKLSLHMMAAVGEFERGTIAQNVKMGMLARAREGKWNGNKVLGYDLVKLTGESGNKKKSESILQVNKNEAEIVRAIFDMYSNGSGYKAITNHINKVGFRTKRGNYFSVSTLKEILRNPVYIGKIRYNVRQNWSEKRRRDINPNPILVDGTHEPIIDIETWNKVQNLLEASKGKPARIYDGEFPLTGILKCPVCGAGMVISRTTNTLKDGTKRRLSYYACGNWKNKGTAACHSNSIRADKANEYVFAKLSELLTNDKLLRDLVENINSTRKGQADPARKEIEKYAKEIDKISSKKKKTFEAYEDGIIDKNEFSIRFHELKNRENELEDKISELKQIVNDDSSEQVSYELIKSILENFNSLLENCSSREQQKKLLHMLISEITISPSREVQSIKININDSLVKYLKCEEGASIRGAPSSCALKKVDIKTLNLKLVV